MTAASSIATLVSLLGQFRGERQTAKEEDYKEFLNLLDETRHKELKTLIESNMQASNSIKMILSEDRSVLLEKLESLDNALAQFASGLEGFSQLVNVVRPTARLSSQAISILRQVEEVGGMYILESRTIRIGGGLDLHIRGGSRSVTIAIEEQRFIEDDIRTLIELNLLRLDYTSQGNKKYIFTRVASDLVKSMKT